MEISTDGTESIENSVPLVVELDGTLHAEDLNWLRVHTRGQAQSFYCVAGLFHVVVSSQGSGQGIVWAGSGDID
jgi:hypothetical protein